MIAIFFGGTVTFLELVVIIRAFLRSRDAGFALGWIAAVLRFILLVAGVSSYLVVDVRAAGTAEAQVSLPLAVVIEAALWGGPLLSFVTLWIASRLMKDAPAAQEERLGKPFNAWLPVALIDAALIVIQLGAFAMGREP